MTRRLPTEFAINMCLEKMMILQQMELHKVRNSSYFNEEDPCHLYFVCKRPRITIDSNSFEVTKDCISLSFKIQIQENFRELPIKLENPFKSLDISLDTVYPYNTFKLIKEGETILNARVPVFLQTLNKHNQDYLDLEVLYIGQSYGVDGARTAPDRLKSHSTLQGIYSEAITNNPDCEIWLALASFNQINIMMLDGRTKFTDEEKQEDDTRYKKVYTKLNWEGINEQQKINFTEAALIRYFEPPYNKIYKDSFPNPAHSTYSECYDLDINSVCIELNTYEMVNCQFYSQKVTKAPWHMHDFLLHSKEDRKSMFEFV